MRENRTHGSEGGEDERPSLPLSTSRHSRPAPVIPGDDRESRTAWIPDHVGDDEGRLGDDEGRLGDDEGLVGDDDANARSTA